jgi:hypothetical protein
MIPPEHPPRVLPLVTEFVKFSVGFVAIITAALFTLHLVSLAL